MSKLPNSTNFLPIAFLSSIYHDELVTTLNSNLLISDGSLVWFGGFEWQAYIQNLETSRLKLAQLEQELTMARRQQVHPQTMRLELRQDGLSLTADAIA